MKQEPEGKRRGQTSSSQLIARLITQMRINEALQAQLPPSVRAPLDLNFTDVRERMEMRICLMRNECQPLPSLSRCHRGR